MSQIPRLFIRGACIPWDLDQLVARARKDLTVYVEAGPPGSTYKYPVHFFVKQKDGVWVPVQYIQSNEQVMLSVVDCRPTPVSLRVTFTGTLRDVQEDIVARSLHMIQSVGGTTLAIPTGMGKTVCALKIASMLRVKVLVLLHKVLLIDQWRENQGIFARGNGECDSGDGG